MHQHAATVPTEAADPLREWPELLTLPQAASVLDASPEWVAAAVTAGELPAKHFGNTCRVLRRGLPRWSTPPR